MVDPGTPLWLIELVRDQPLLLIPLVIGTGCVIGQIPIWRFRVGASGGVLFAGLAFGHFGFEPPPLLETLGFIFFIYCVGVQAGPRFFVVIRQDGFRYFCLALLIAIWGLTLAGVLGRFLGLAPGYAAGILAGAMTSTPCLIAARDVINSGAVDTAAGLGTEDLLLNLSTAYAITYVFGMLGLIIFIRALPALLRFDLASAASALGAEQGLLPDDHSLAQGQLPRNMQVRAFLVLKPDLLGRSPEELRKLADGRIRRAKLLRDGALLPLEAGLTLQLQDRVSLIGYVDKLVEAGTLLGPEVHDPELLNVQSGSHEIVVLNKKAAGSSLRELGLYERFGVFVQTIQRAGTPMPVSSEFVIERGDVLMVSGLVPCLEEAAGFLGMSERRADQTGIVTLMFAIALGLVIGSFTVTVGRLSIGLGMAGGLLITGILVGYGRSLFPVFGRMPNSVRWVFSQLGLLVFMACVGLRAGEGIVEALLDSGLTLVGAGMLLTISPAVLGYAFGRLVLRLNPVMALGALTGAMTSTPALGVLSDQSKSPLPAMGYAGAYAFANIFLAIAGSIIVRL